MTHRNFTGEKVYLGDAVYVTLDTYGCVVLTTEDGIRTTNRVVLEPEVLSAFTAWVERNLGKRRDG